MNKMKKSYKIIFLILTFALIFILPLFGSILRWKGLPPGYGEFPSQQAVKDPGFNMIYFIAGVLLASIIACFFMFPKLFGFRKVILEEKIKSHTAFPVWFWWSMPVFVLSWFFTWSRINIFFNLESYTFVPLWWSFILILDGIVYKRNNGKSLISERPNTLKLLSVISCFSWFAFEYLNFFVMENWYYPNNEVFSKFGNTFWFSLSYTTVLPAIFEWYMLLKTFKYFRYRYSNGPKLQVSTKALMVYYLVGLFLAFGMGYYPYLLFWVLWVALIPLLSAAMALTGYWTPFTPIKDGDWSPTMLIALATLFNGFFWEMWNFGSEWFHNGEPVNPNYWKYSVPYLDKLHIFSEMPILGYWGYLFFGVNCWIIWLIAGYIFDFDTSFDITNE